MTLVFLLGDYWASLAAFGVFGLLHSIGAREPFKNRLAQWTSLFFVEHFWRFLYCVLSYVALYYGVASLHWARHPESDIWLVVYPDWLWQVMTVLHLGKRVPSPYLPGGERIKVRGPLRLYAHALTSRRAQRLAATLRR